MIICVSVGITYGQSKILSSVLHGQPGRLNCYLAWDVNRLKFHLTFLLIYALPLLSLIGFMSYYCVKISCYMKREARKAQNVMEVGKCIRKRNQKALKVLILLILVFIFTVMPARGFNYLWLNYVYFESESVMVDWNWRFWIVIEYMSYVSTLLNNVLNCVVYARMMNDYRKLLKDIFTLGLLRRKSRKKKIRTRQNVALEMKEK